MWVYDTQCRVSTEPPNCTNCCQFARSKLGDHHDTVNYFCQTSVLMYAYWCAHHKHRFNREPHLLPLNVWYFLLVSQFMQKCKGMYLSVAVVETLCQFPHRWPSALRDFTLCGQHRSPSKPHCQAGGHRFHSIMLAPRWTFILKMSQSPQNKRSALPRIALLRSKPVFNQRGRGATRGYPSYL